jgi:hypothetical protein
MDKLAVSTFEKFPPPIETHGLADKIIVAGMSSADADAIFTTRLANTNITEAAAATAHFTDGRTLAASITFRELIANRPARAR